MDQKSIKLMLPIIAGIVGWIMTGHFVAGVFFAIIIMVLLPLSGVDIAGSTKSKRAFGEDEGFIHVVLLLSAAVIKADGRIYKKERDLVRHRLAHDFNPSQVENYMRDLEVCLTKKINVDGVCAKVRQTLNYPAKIQLLHFLTGLTVTNGSMVDSEFDLLLRISNLIDLPERSFASILAMFSYQRIVSYQDRKSSSNYRAGQGSSYGAIAKAYQILEIEASATDDEVKKAYRRLAKLHHPDRVVHLGPEFQKNAKIKFQKIADAYELIKSNRNIK